MGLPVLVSLVQILYDGVLLQVLTLENDLGSYQLVVPCL